MMQLTKCVFKTKYSKNKSIKNIIDRLKIYVYILVITTKGYGVLATTIGGCNWQNVSLKLSTVKIKV